MKKKELEDLLKKRGIKKDGVGWTSLIEDYNIPITSSSARSPDMEMLRKLLEAQDKELDQGTVFDKAAGPSTSTLGPLPYAHTKSNYKGEWRG